MSEEMENRLAIVIAVDGLRASALGTYGNTSFPTPHFDELASRSLVVEWLLAESPLLEEFYRAAWNPLPTESVRRWLLTDAGEVAQFTDNRFDEVVQIERSRTGTAREIEETHTAQFFTQVIEQLALWQKGAAEHSGGLLWIHFSGLCGPWDAPLDLRDALMDEEDLESPIFVDPPASISIADDPDELLRYRVAYAAQVAVLNSCLAGVFDAFETLSTESDWLAMIIGSRGFSLGEHGVVGDACDMLYSEQLHLPWLLLNNDTRQPVPRAAGFAQPVDIGHTLRDWLERGEPRGKFVGHSLVPLLSGHPVSLRDRAFSSNAAGEKAIRTSAWMMKQGKAIELYSKPDDRWEANNVASRCPDIVELLSDCLQTPDACPQPLPTELLSAWR